MEITEEDIKVPDQDWAPLPLDRDEPRLQAVTEILDQTIEAVRSDNGYASNVPEERDLILDTLRSTSSKLKTSETISLAYFKVNLLPKVNLLISRFKDAATGALAATLRQSIIEYLVYLRKKHLGF